MSDINSPDRDNTPLVSADGNVLFFNSTRLGSRPWASLNPLKKRYDDDIYFSYRVPSNDGMEHWSEPINVGPELNSSEDDGVVAISPDGQTLYFNSLKRGWEHDGGPFYKARLSGNKWTDIQGLGGGITDFFSSRDLGQRYRIYGGSISSDGKDFYFATTVHSDNGKHQIWVAHFNGREWGYPENLGPAINNGSGSYAPCIAADGKTLYFTTNREGGYGGDDIYISVLNNGVWGAPFNVGAPINTEQDDAFISLAASGDKAYLSRTVDSNEDIYVALLPVKSRPTNVILVSGQVTDKATGLPLEATIVIEDLQTGAKIFEANSNSISGQYTTVLRPGHDYGISISAPGYVFHSARYPVPQVVAYDKMHHDFQLQKLAQGEKFVANNIFFDYNTADLRSESKPELDRLVTMMKEHPQLILQINGHTDNIGSSDFNMQLSLRRAEAVKHYLVETGTIVPERITTQGFGFSKPIAPNATEDGRQQNRRSEFTILQL
ncbi:MAG TPA: OmpA family protein [Candidatus Kapabacteria bacterium]|nr:OmpA family protein [Candidatus Kapabacteria bacterium]